MKTIIDKNKYSDESILKKAVPLNKIREDKRSPGILLSNIIVAACIKDLPWLNLNNHPKDQQKFLRWKKHMDPMHIAKLMHQETVLLRPFGPSGMWARQRFDCGRWWRPHKMEEVFVEAMYPRWTNSFGHTPPYVTVLSSGPYSLCLVYLNGKYQYEIAYPFPPIWQEDLKQRSLVFNNEAVCRYGLDVAGS